MTIKSPPRPTTTAHPSAHPPRRRGAMAALRDAEVRHARRRRLVVAALVLTVVAGVVTAMMLSSQPESSTASRLAPGFTLTTTAGTQVSLADFRGKDVLLYFSEGAGCGSCLAQMAAIEKDKRAFAKADLTVLPVVMNSRDQIMKDMSAYGVHTPFLLDDGRVSREYGTLGQGMHAGLPGHSFVLIDANGIQRWYGEYPAMWLSTSDLLAQVREHLAA